MKKVLFALFILFSEGLYAQDRPFYIGINIVNGISMPTGDKEYNKFFKSAYAPSVGIILEKKLNHKLAIQSGISLVDRSCHIKSTSAPIFDPDLIGVTCEVNENLLYLSAPLCLKINWKGFYISPGAEFGIPFYVYNIQKSPDKRTYKGEYNSKKLLLSFIFKAGYDLKLKNNILFFDFVINQDIKRFDKENSYNNKRLNVGIGLGYKINLSKK